MLRDLTRKDWLIILGIPESRIPQALVLRGTRNLKTQYHAYRAFFDNILDLDSPNGVIEDMFIGNLEGLSVAYASVYGAPMTSEVVHVCGILGTRLVVQTGCCGALADEIKPGDLFTATEAYCGEGASQYYRPESNTVEASPSILSLLRADSTGDVAMHFGPIYTTSALFAESRKEVEDWFHRGFSAIDMETSATFTVAEYFGMDRLSILFAYDCPRKQEHLFMSDADKDERRRQGNHRMMELAFRTVKKYLTGEKSRQNPGRDR